MHRLVKFQGSALKLCLMGALAVSVAAGAAWAADPQGTAPAVKAVIQCRAITDTTERLACYDKTVDAMAGADAKGDLITLDQEQRKAIRHQAFGFTMPSFTLFDKGEKPEEASKATFKIAQAWQDLEHKWNFKLETGAGGGATHTNQKKNNPPPRTGGDKSNGARGSFFMKVDGQQAIRVMRVS